jgi:hypothetical protein
MIVASALTRLLPHPPNFAPITAMALFAGAHIQHPLLAFAVPISAMILSDMGLELMTGWGFYSGMWIVYGTFILITVLGRIVRNRIHVVSVFTATMAGSTVFFLLTNFGVWFGSSLYPKTLDGLAACYSAALPFFQNSVLGDLFFSAVLFGGFALAERSLGFLHPAERSSQDNTSHHGL